MNNIASGLKKQREIKGMSVKQVVEKLAERGFDYSDKTVYSWESGKRMPDGDTLLVLCDIYSTNDILKTFGYKKPDNEAEAVDSTVDIVSRLSPVDQAHIRALALRLSGHSEQSGDGRAEDVK
jgi:transcriptional regulator with XRE-family HTH domain